MRLPCSSGTIWLLIHKYANVYSLYSACPFYNLLFKYYLITSLAWLDFIIV